MLNKNYEEPKLDIVQLQTCDVITESDPSGAFKGEDDTLGISNLELPL